MGQMGGAVALTTGHVANETQFERQNTELRKKVNSNTAEKT
eukprot:SAG11_NODE_33285_length_278_cov_0.581006_1_plen_40_part_10